MSNKIINVAIAWNGLPYYAAAQLKLLLNNPSYNLYIIGTRPKVPVTGMDCLLDNKIKWINSDIRIDWRNLNIPIPQIFVHTGWAYKSFNHLADQVLEQSGKVVSIIDNIKKNNIRQFLGKFYFKYKFQNRFTAYWVPGQSSKDFCMYLGADEDKIFTGVYAADANLFMESKPILQRPFNFLFIGQFINRKSVFELSVAFEQFLKIYPNWTLTLIGSGPLRTSLCSNNNIIIKDFMQADSLVNEYNNARCFILPSKEEHFGLVVHEACLCGCPLILSNNIGAIPELANQSNSIIYKDNSVECIYKALLKFAQLQDNFLLISSLKSKELANKLGGVNFVNSFNSILQYCQINK